jgi:hypothetical protein
MFAGLPGHRAVEVRLDEPCADQVAAPFHPREVGPYDVEPVDRHAPLVREDLDEGQFGLDIGEIRQPEGLERPGHVGEALHEPRVRVRLAGGDEGRRVLVLPGRQDRRRDLTGILGCEDGGVEPFEQQRRA